jgi:hypothetical protein
MRMNGKELAKRLGCARSTLSEATKRGYMVSGRWDVQAWAVCQPSGRLKHYEVPDDCAFLAEPEPEAAAEPRPNPPASPDSVQAAAPVVAEGARTVSLLPPGEDYSRTVQSGSLAYVAGKAIEHDTPTARGVVLGLGGLVGAVAGHETSDGSALGTLVGCLLGVGVIALGVRYLRPEPHPPTLPSTTAALGGDGYAATAPPALWGAPPSGVPAQPSY